MIIRPARSPAASGSLWQKVLDTAPHAAHIVFAAALMPGRGGDGIAAALVRWCIVFLRRLRVVFAFADGIALGTYPRRPIMLPRPCNCLQI